MKTLYQITIGMIVAILLPITISAQVAPSPVTGIDAEYKDGEVVARWEADSAEPIAYYRVYYSTESILDNDGLYDDFEVTDDNNTEFGFVAPQEIDALYIAVIAVAESGLESEFFTEEARVELPQDTSVPAGVFKEYDENAPPEDQEPVDMSPVRLLKATVESPEVIVIEFSSPITIEPERAPEGLRIEGPDQKALGIKRIVIEDNTVTIYTAMQTRGTVYDVQFSEPFSGKNGRPLDVDDRSVLVTGHKDAKEPPPPAPPPVESGLPDLVDISMVPQPQDNGLYTVTLEWVPVDTSGNDLYGIVAYQTRDGQTFGPPNLLPLEIRGVTLNDVTPGFFGIYLQTVDTQGFTSPGVFQYATLPVFVPGQGLQGSLTLGSVNASDQAEDAPTEVATTKQEDVATLEPITEETQTAPLEGVDHSAAFENALRIRWDRVALLIGSSLGIMMLMIGGWVLLRRRS